MKLLNPWELLLIVFVLVLIFGSKRLPQMGRSMGGAIRGFKDSVSHRIEQQERGALHNFTINCGQIEAAIQ